AQPPSARTSAGIRRPAMTAAPEDHARINVGGPAKVIAHFHGCGRLFAPQRPHRHSGICLEQPGFTHATAAFSGAAAIAGRARPPTARAVRTPTRERPATTASAGRKHSPTPTPLRRTTQGRAESPPSRETPRPPPGAARKPPPNPPPDPSARPAASPPPPPATPKALPNRWVVLFTPDALPTSWAATALSAAVGA